MNYLNQSEVMATTVNLQGEIVNKKREMRHYFVPTMGYAFGHNFDNGLGWFAKLSAGMKLSPEQVNMGMIFTEVGVRIKLKGEQK